MAGGFFLNTRSVSARLAAITRPTGGGISSFQLPKIGFLHGLQLLISATVTGTLSAPNALGAASIIKRVRLQTNSAIDIVNVSGAGFAYLWQEMMEHEGWLAQGQNTGRNAVTATTFNLDMIIPVALNKGNPLGVLMLQNEQTVVTCQIEWEADATVATGATVTATATPVVEYYTVPVDPRDYPPLNVLVTTIQDDQAVAAAGDYQYTLPRGYIYTQVAHGLGIGAAGADGFNRFQVRIGQSQFPYDWTTAYMDAKHRELRGRARPLGAIFVDYLAQAGDGVYSPFRDTLNSAKVTDLVHIITATGAGTLYTLRRQIVPLS